MLMAWLSSRGAYITNGSCLVSLQESAYRCRALSRQTALSDSNIDLLNREPAWRRREKSAKLTRIDNRRHKHDSTAALDDKMQPISRYEFKMEPNRFRDRDLSFTGDGSGWHTLLPSDFCRLHLMVFHPNRTALLRLARRSLPAATSRVRVPPATPWYILHHTLS